MYYNGKDYLILWANREYTEGVFQLNDTVTLLIKDNDDIVNIFQRMQTSYTSASKIRKIVIDALPEPDLQVRLKEGQTMEFAFSDGSFALAISRPKGKKYLYIVYSAYPSASKYMHIIIPMNDDGTFYVKGAEYVYLNTHEFRDDIENIIKKEDYEEDYEENYDEEDYEEDYDEDYDEEYEENYYNMQDDDYNITSEEDLLRELQNGGRYRISHIAFDILPKLRYSNGGFVIGTIDAHKLLYHVELPEELKLATSIALSQIFANNSPYGAMSITNPHILHNLEKMKLYIQGQQYEIDADTLLAGKLIASTLCPKGKILMDSSNVNLEKFIDKMTYRDGSKLSPVHKYLLKKLTANVPFVIITVSDIKEMMEELDLTPAELIEELDKIIVETPYPTPTVPTSVTFFDELDEFLFNYDNNLSR